eukprot:3100513-Pyramimonas_sp.AAC.1
MQRIFSITQEQQQKADGADVPGYSEKAGSLRAKLAAAHGASQFNEASGEEGCDASFILRLLAFFLNFRPSFPRVSFFL